ncbi:MAG: hypothetical protein ACRDTD_03275 [Pseudonocardiaceae bacterium]
MAACTCCNPPRSQVVGLGTHLIYVRFDQGGQLIALRPHLVRVLDSSGGC